MRKLLLTAIILSCLIVSCDSTDTDLEIADAVQLAPRNPETYMVYIQPGDTCYHLMNPPCLHEDKQVISEASALEQGYIPCEICFPLPPEIVEPKVYVMSGSDLYHASGCPLLDDTKQAILKTEALVDHTACPRCLPGEYTPPPPSVYIDPELMIYHFALCPALTGEEESMLKSESIEAGYTPHDCALELTVHGGIVYVTEDGHNSKIYHTNPMCKHLDSYREEDPTLLSIMYMKRNLVGYSQCKDCGEERHIDE